MLVTAPVFGDYYQKADTQLWETIGTMGSTAATQYVGFAQTSKHTEATPDTTAAVWKIKKITYDSSGEVLTIKHARPSSKKLYGETWTNRLSATYY